MASFLNPTRGKGWSLTFGVLYFTSVFSPTLGILWELVIGSRTNHLSLLLKLNMSTLPETNSESPWTLLVLKMKFNFSGLGSLFRGCLSQGMGEKNGPKEKKKQILWSCTKTTALLPFLPTIFGDHNFQRISTKIFWETTPHPSAGVGQHVAWPQGCCGLESFGRKFPSPSFGKLQNRSPQKVGCKQ